MGDKLHKDCYYMVDTIETDAYDTIWAEILWPIPVGYYTF
jgi:hypothetical protein